MCRWHGKSIDDLNPKRKRDYENYSLLCVVIKSSTDRDVVSEGQPSRWWKCVCDCSLAPTVNVVGTCQLEPGVAFSGRCVYPLPNEPGCLLSGVSGLVLGHVTVTATKYRLCCTHCICAVVLLMCACPAVQVFNIYQDINTGAVGHTEQQSRKAAFHGP